MARQESLDVFTENRSDLTAMNAIGHIYIGLPAYNEETALPKLLRRIEFLSESLQKTVTVVLYNDGSTDSTGAIARQWQGRLPPILIYFPPNKSPWAPL